MAVLSSVYITLLSLFFHQALVVSASDHIDTTKPDHIYTGIGPQVNITIGSVPGKLPPLPMALMCYHWKSDFHLNNEAEGIKVYRNDTGVVTYTIYPYPGKDRGFTVRDVKNVTLVAAEDKARRGAPCQFKHDYHAFESKTPVTYSMKPRGLKTDHWYITVGENDQETKFTYFRARHSSAGTLNRTSDNAFVASVEFADMKLPNSTTEEKVVMLKIDTTFAEIDTSYVIGLWNMVKKRMRRCGR